MSSTPLPKQALLQLWLKEHAPGNYAPLFASRAPDFKPTAEAISLLQRPVVSQGMYLYIVCLGSESEPTIPVYVGKAANPWKRWNTGHLAALRQAYRTNIGRYTRWIALFEQHPETLYLMCLHESHIQFPPLPDFPLGVGAVEYQLISLAADAYPETLLNDEGVAR